MSKKQSRIVIVEDDPTFSGIYEGNFSDAGFAVSIAADGASGLAVIKKEMPQLVVLDIMVPQLSGFEILAAMRADRALKKIPVIVVTNLDQHAERDKAMALGADAYFVKAHAVFSEVLAKVRELVE